MIEELYKKEESVDKNFKIWGMSYGVFGDLIAGLPMLTYFEKKYPGSYKYWVIEKKCAECAPLYFNQPLIDRIKITDNWGGCGEEDNKLKNECQVKTIQEGWKHDRPDWYNYRSNVEETARLAGIFDMSEVLTEEEMKPKLHKWFSSGIFNPANHTYSKKEIVSVAKLDIAIWPITGTHPNTSPKIEWWKTLTNRLSSMGYVVGHFGFNTDPTISNAERFTNYSFFEQMKISLSSKLVIGTDSGTMWITGAYSHPAISLITNYFKNHNSNKLALAPINDNGLNIFYERNSNLSIDEVIEAVERRIV